MVGTVEGIQGPMQVSLLTQADGKVHIAPLNVNSTPLKLPGHPEEERGPHRPWEATVVAPAPGPRDPPIRVSHA